MRLLAAWAQAPQLAGEGHQELVAALRAPGPGDTLDEDTAVEAAVDRRLNAALEVAAGPLKSLLIDQEKALKGVGQSPVEDRSLGSPGGNRRECGRRRNSSPLQPGETESTALSLQRKPSDRARLSTRISPGNGFRRRPTKVREAWPSAAG